MSPRSNYDTARVLGRVPYRTIPRYPHHLVFLFSQEHSRPLLKFRSTIFSSSLFDPLSMNVPIHSDSIHQEGNPTGQFGSRVLRRRRHGPQGRHDRRRGYRPGSDGLKHANGIGTLQDRGAGHNVFWNEFQE